MGQMKICQQRIDPLELVGRVDEDAGASAAAHGDTLNAWKKMGSPLSPTQAQIAALRKASEIGPPEFETIHSDKHSDKHGDKLTLTLPPMGLVLIEIPAPRRAAAEPMH